MANRQDPNEVQSQKEAKEIVRGPHTYDPSTRSYTKKPFEYQEFPKTLYHPEYGKKAAPSQSDFSILPTATPEQMQKVLAAYQTAMLKWARSNRTKVAHNKAEEARLLKKGWVVELPKPAEAAISQEDDEI